MQANVRHAAIQKMWLAVCLLRPSMRFDQVPSCVGTSLASPHHWCGSCYPWRSPHPTKSIREGARCSGLLACGAGGEWPLCTEPGVIVIRATGRQRFHHQYQGFPAPAVLIVCDGQK